jgi:hypothetical protein
MKTTLSHSQTISLIHQNDRPTPQEDVFSYALDIGLADNRNNK